MVPRSGMVTLPREVSFTQMMEEVHKTRHARYLVIDDSLDNVLGVLDLRQLADPIAKGEMQANTSLEPYIKPVVRVLETSTLAELLPLIKNGNPLLLVVDEYGGTEGLITSADLTGEIVGDEIQFDNKESELRPIDDSKKIWITSGEIEVIELNRELNLELPEADDHYTLAGFVLEKLQEIPNTGETFVHNEIIFEIISMKGPRINKVKIILEKWIDPALITHYLTKKFGDKGLAWLDSDGKENGEWSLIGIKPKKIIQSRDINNLDKNNNPFNNLKNIEKGFWIGWLSYEAGVYIEPKNSWRQSEMATLWIASYDPIIKCNLIKKEIIIEGTNSYEMMNYKNIINNITFTF